MEVKENRNTFDVPNTLIEFLELSCHKCLHKTEFARTGHLLFIESPITEFGFNIDTLAEMSIFTHVQMQ
jgi:hypothetical protein